MPSLKAKETAKIIMENHGKIGVSTAMEQAGYSPATAKNPKNLTESKGWEDLLEHYFPDEKLNQKLEEGLESYTYRGRRKIEDFEARHKYVNTILKLKKKFPDEKLKLGTDKDEPLEITFVDERKNPTDE